MTHTSDAVKNEIQVNWTAPEPGSGCVTFRATIIEHRDVWYMDDGPLSRDFCEDEANQDDFISNVQEECCACFEAKYEVDFVDIFRLLEISKRTEIFNFNLFVVIILLNS